jgi:hypothetical protein
MAGQTKRVFWAGGGFAACQAVGSGNEPTAVEISSYASRPFVQAVRRKAKLAKLERLPMNEKLPLITLAEVNDHRVPLRPGLGPASVL